MIRNAWRISGGSGWCGNTANRRVLVKHADGRETVEELKDDLGGPKDAAGVLKALQKQGIADAAEVKLFGSVDNRTGGGASRPPGAAEGGGAKTPPQGTPSSGGRKKFGAGPSSIVFG